MKELDYGQGYVYAHDTQEKLSTMQCMPDSLKGQTLLPPHRTGGGKKSSKARLESVLQWKREHSEE